MLAYSSGLGSGAAGGSGAGTVVGLAVGSIFLLFYARARVQFLAVNIASILACSAAVRAFQALVLNVQVCADCPLISLTQFATLSILA